MNIKTKKINDVTAQIIVTVQREDVQSEMEKSFKHLRKSTMIDGFRKGSVPRSILQNRYGKNIFLQELNKLISNQISEYIKKNDLTLLGEPILNANHFDLGHLETYEFVFDIGMQPNMKINLTKENKFSCYTIEITEEMIERKIRFFRNQYGYYCSNIDYIEEKDRVRGKLARLGQKKNDIREVVLIPFCIKDDSERVKFIGKRVGETILFSPYKAFGGVESDLSFFLQKKKDKLKKYRGDFTFTVSEISRYQQAEIDRKLFDKVYGVGVVLSEKSFKERIKEDLSLQLRRESDYRLLFDLGQLLLERVQQVRFPEDFLKRWWKEIHPTITLEILEKDFPKIIENIKMQCIWSKMIEENGLTVNSEELQQTAKEFAYNYEGEFLKTEKGLSQLRRKMLEIKIIQCLKEKTTLIPVTITEEEFRKLSKNNSQ